MSVLRTKDYEMFKKSSANRDINEFNVKQLMKSISVKNLLDERPILVDKEMRVMDGQNRLEAARRLNIEIAYSVCENIMDEDIILLNANQKNWQLTDYLNYYVKKSNTQYVTLNDFLEKNKLSIMQMRALMNEGEKFSDKFKKGEFTFPKNGQFSKVAMRLENLRFVQEYIALKMPETKICYDGSHFIHGLLEFFNNKKVDIGVFTHKLEYKLDLLRPSTNRVGYINMFKAIYNFKNENPIE